MGEAVEIKYESGQYLVVKEDDDLRQVIAEAVRVGATGTFERTPHYRLQFVGTDMTPRFYPEPELQARINKTMPANDPGAGSAKQPLENKPRYTDY